MKPLLFILLLLNVHILFSQAPRPAAKKTPDVFEEAYIVTLKGDTVRGHIKLPKGKLVEIYQKINFRDNKNKIKLLTPDKISGYGYKNYYYISAFLEDKSCFFKVLCKGKLSLFQTVFDIPDEGLVEELCVMEDKSDAHFKVLEEDGIKKQLKEIFKTNKPLVQKIMEQKQFEFSTDTIQFYINEYNKASVN
jgi:hypothetical protein